MKVLVSDNLGDVGIKMFQEESGIEVDVKTGLAPDELKRIIGEYDALVIRSATKVYRRDSSKPPGHSKWSGGPVSVWIMLTSLLPPNGGSS